MKAVEIIKPGKVQIRDIPEPAVSDEDVLIKVKALGLCGSDLSTYRGQNPLVSYPRIPGHEIAGEIVHTGKKVPADFKVGSSVTVLPYTACGKCSACRIGRVNCCRYNQTMGVQRDGAATEYIAVPYKKVITASGFSDEQIACIEPLSVGWHASCRGRVAPVDKVLVFGCGVIGLGAIAAAAFKRAEVTAVDIDGDKLRKAGAVGARYLINSQQENLAARVEELTFGDGFDVVIEAAGMPETFIAAVEMVSFAGRVVYIGYAKKPVDYETKLFVSKELDVNGSRNALKSDFGAVISMLASVAVDVKPLVTQRYELEAFADAMSFWDKNPTEVTKILIEV
ncbi:MAG: zinc-binding alcohol dehydrogenase family protein [Planctomycetota bacterium]|jgi:2-desacetyl-2-hydroxyethyl bacteriochlorophyllide A dehydrogenase